MGIEPTFLAWEANVLPLNYTRILLLPSQGRISVLTITHILPGKQISFAGILFNMALSDTPSYPVRQICADGIAGTRPP